MDDTPLQKVAIDFAASRSMTILPSPLGMGTDGSVWKTSARTAVKAFHAKANFDCELECYKRLLRANISDLFGFAVPRLVDYDQKLLVIEMETVQPPYVLDFGKVYLDRRPDYSDEVMQEFRSDQQDLWGRHYGIVRKILWSLEQLGIYYTDPKPGNIMPEDWNAE